MAVDRPIFGASNSDTSLFTGGALSALETIAGGKNQAQQAMELTRALTPQRQEFDPALAAMKYFVGMTKAASQKGATLLGSAAQAVVEPAAYLEQINDYNRKLTASQGQTAVTLAGALKPAKSAAGGFTNKPYTLQKNVDGVGIKGQVVTLTNVMAAQVIKADPTALLEYKAPTSGSTSFKAYGVSEANLAGLRTALDLPSLTPDADGNVLLTDAQASVGQTQGLIVPKVSTTSSKVGTPKAYSVSAENLAALNTELGTELTRDILGNVTLTPDQFVKGQNFLGGAAGKPAQGSAFERNFNIVNDIGSRIAAFTLDPTLPAISREELNEYSAKYQKLVVGGEYEEEVGGQLVTRRRAGIDLEATTNLPIPEGLDLNAIIEERRQQFDQGQNTNATFGSRMLYSEGIIRNVMAEGYVLTIEDLARIATMDRLGLGTIGLDPLAKQYHVAAQNWISAQLRNESGAAISPSEYANALTEYFPVVGDDADTIKQKQALREANVRGMIQSSQGAFEVIYPSGSQYLSYTDAIGETYDNVLNAQGYANQLLANTELGNTLFFSDGLRLKTTEALRDMLANPNAATLFTSQMIDMINAEIAREGR
jgi:hypothetical protein|tara:strand:+ start:2386 stop:4179 length:1794 start_codon:yes stop_codon:yes gene_type:complete